jgi:CRISPR-associated endonuclease Csy4
MNHYVDIQILENSDFETTFLLNRLYEKFHFGLVEGGVSLQIGASFPNISFKPMYSLGNVLRLHGDREDLASFIGKQWFGSLLGYVNVGRVLSIPAEVEVGSVRRVQIQSSAERLRRRFMRRHDVDMATARLKIPDTASKKNTNLPWLQLRSSSTGQEFRLFVEVRMLGGPPVIGKFNRYGLSSTATVPIF